MKDIISMAVDSQLNSGNEEEAKIKFCDKLLEEFRKMEGEDLAPHLHEATFVKSKKKTMLVLFF